MGWLLGGVAVVEMVFSWPGLGNMAVYAITMRDYPLIEGFVLWVALAYMCINALIDASYVLLDPRLKRGESIMAEFIQNINCSLSIAALMLLVVLIAIFAPWLAPGDAFPQI